MLNEEYYLQCWHRSHSEQRLRDHRALWWECIFHLVGPATGSRRDPHRGQTRPDEGRSPGNRRTPTPHLSSSVWNLTVGGGGRVKGWAHRGGFWDKLFDIAAQQLRIPRPAAFNQSIEHRAEIWNLLSVITYLGPKSCQLFYSAENLGQKKRIVQVKLTIIACSRTSSSGHSAL